jgi:pyridoxine 5-phosphate synthase
MIELGVNIDHVATIRQARRGQEPCPLQAALQAEEYGADAITVHVREDRRHMQDADVRAIAPVLCTRMNFECAVVEEMLRLVEEVRPHDVCLVPERREEITTEGGLNVLAYSAALGDAVQRLQGQGMRVSLFIDPELAHIEKAVSLGAKAVELHTGAYAHATGQAQAEQLQRLQKAVEHGVALGLRVNAGHGLNYQNVSAVAAIDGIAELNIGHSIVANAVFMGWERAIKTMKALMIAARLATLRPRA